MTREQVLDKLDKLNRENIKLYKRKADLESESLEIDIKLSHLTGKYSDIIEKLIENYD